MKPVTMTTAHLDTLARVTSRMTNQGVWGTEGERLSEIKSFLQSHMDTPPSPTRKVPLDWPERFAVYAFDIMGYDSLNERDKQICDDAAEWAHRLLQSHLDTPGVPETKAPMFGCSKCGYFGGAAEHSGCDYYASKCAPVDPILSGIFLRMRDRLQQLEPSGDTPGVRVPVETMAAIHVALTSIRDEARGHPFVLPNASLDHIERLADEAITKLLGGTP